MCAPTGPIQFLAGPAPGGGADTLNETSCGEYESRLSASRKAMLRPTNPTSSLIRLFSVGDRIRTSFPFCIEKPAVRDSKYSTSISLRGTVYLGLGCKSEAQKAGKAHARYLDGAGANARSPVGGTRATKRLYQTRSASK